MEEVEQQGNRCPKCQKNNIQYPINNPKSNIHSFGDSPNCFTSLSVIDWTATCLECGTNIPIHSSYDYDIKTGFEINSGDFFLAENGNYGHSKRELF